MYSPRKYSYRTKHRKYHKYNIKDIYSPSLYKAPRPNYYQMKGRVLQQTPAYMHEPPVDLMSWPKMNEMYNKLVQYKFPFPSPQFPVQPFIINDYWFGRYLFTQENPVLTRERFKGFMDEYMLSKFGDLFTQFPNWQYQLFYFQLSNKTADTMMENVQFHIDWSSRLIPQNSPYQVVLKTINNPMQATYTTPSVFVQPYSTTQLKVYKLTFVNSGAANQGNSNLNSADSNPTDQGFYPIIDTAAKDSDLYASQLEWVGETYPTDFPNLRFYFDVLCQPIIN